MRFGPVALSDAHGAVLAHTHRLPDGTLPKGRVLGATDLARLAAHGVEEVIAAVLEPGDISEDDAAHRVAAALAGPGTRLGKATTGRCNLFATATGLLTLDADAIHRANRVHESVTIATLPPWQRVVADELVATVKIIPFGVAGSRADAAAEAATGAVQVAPFTSRRAALVLSELDGTPPRVLTRGHDVQAARLIELGSELVFHTRCRHEVAAVATGLRAALDQGADPVLFLGASAIIDRDDVFPAALRAIGGEVVHLGMPTDPGNLLVLGRHGTRWVIGVPGCARSPRPSGFDAVLARIAAGLDPTADDLAEMGVGGLLKEMAERPAPRLGRPPRSPLAAVVLAAGASRRMGPRNKLLIEVEGRPMVARVVDAVADVAEVVVVVTGHDVDAVHHALADRDVRWVHNPDWPRGMSTSLGVGIGALPDDVVGAFIALGDLPFLQTAHVRAIAEAFDPSTAPIVVPVHQRKRGHPVLWSRRYFAELQALAGDRGARALLDVHADDVCLVEVSGPGVHLDLDTPEAVAAHTTPAD